MRPVLTAAIVAALALPARADRAPPKPAKLFQQLASSVTDAGFHLNDSHKTDWSTASVCRAQTKPKHCKLVKASWSSSIVADEKVGKSSVVQELWSFEYGSAADAVAGAASLDKEFEFGPFAKHPYDLFPCGDHVFAVEGRWRWRSARKKLSAHVEAFLDKKCS